MRRFVPLLLASGFAVCVALSQDTKPDPPGVPADRSAAAYEVYAKLLTGPAVSHSGENAKHLIEEVTRVYPEENPAKCTLVPPDYRSQFDEILEDYAQHKDKHFRLERKIAIAKPYDFLNPDEVKKFMELRGGPGTKTDDVEKFRGAFNLIQLGNVYFSRDRRLAAVRAGSWCGGLCGHWPGGSWRKNKTDTGRTSPGAAVLPLR